MIEGYLTSADVAERAGIARTSVHRYRARGDIPPPDAYVGRTPLWRNETIETWLANRPGHGWRGRAPASGDQGDEVSAGDR